MFDNNFGKCRAIFKILLPANSQENSLRLYNKEFHLTCYILLHYLVKFKKAKVLPNFFMLIIMFN